MREFARAFYLSKEAREYIFTRDGGLCVRCGKLSEIVHHRRHLTPDNIRNPEIALGAGNLELLCCDCHALAHAGELPTDIALTFDENVRLPSLPTLPGLPHIWPEPPAIRQRKKAATHRQKARATQEGTVTQTVRRLDTPTHAFSELRPIPVYDSLWQNRKLSMKTSKIPKKSE